MTIAAKPRAEVAIDVALVRALLEEQHPDLAHGALRELGEGWDNALFRLGDDLVVRLPRRADAAALVEQEQRWLAHLAPDLPLPVPIPRRVGRPGRGFPWSWSITPWFPGRSAVVEPPRDPVETAARLGQFLRALHQPAPADAPHNPWRSVPLSGRDSILRTNLQQAAGLVSPGDVLALWERALAAPVWPGTPFWIHGDLHPGNLLVSEGRLSAVIDFGDLAAGDPATDLAVSWMLFPPSARPAFWAAARSEVDPIDDHTLMRARGWALALGLACCVNSQDDEAMHRLALSTIAAALSDG